jgi:hypothetical protein
MQSAVRTGIGIPAGPNERRKSRPASSVLAEAIDRPAQTQFEAPVTCGRPDPIDFSFFNPTLTGIMRSTHAHRMSDRLNFGG